MHQVIQKMTKNSTVVINDAVNPNGELVIEDLFLIILESDAQSLFSDLVQEHLTEAEMVNLRFDLRVGAKTVLGNTSGLLNHAADRFLDTDSLIAELINDPAVDKVLKNVLAKYINILHLKEDFMGGRPTIPNMEWSPNANQILQKYGRNLSEMSSAGELSEIVGRHDETVRMVNVLARQTKSNPILVGDAGVGKTAVVEKLAKFIQDRINIPSSLYGFEIIEINMAKLLADGAPAGAMEKIIPEIIREARGKYILFMDEVHAINNDSGRIANLLKPAMARDEIKLIGATTEDEFKTFEKDEAIQRRFARIKINEPSSTTIYNILKIKAEEIQEYQGIIIPQITLLAAIELSDRYQQNRKQPDKAIDLLEEASAMVRTNLETKPEGIIFLEHEIDELKLELEIDSVKGNEIPHSERHMKEMKGVQDRLTQKKNELKELNLIFVEQNKLLISLDEAKESLIKDTATFTELLFEGKFNDAAEYKTVILPEDKFAIKDIETSILEMAEEVDTNMIQNIVTPNSISVVIEKQTGIPIDTQKDDLKKYYNMEEQLNKIVHGQSKPIRLISNAIKRAKAGLSDPNKPLGSFLCFGPTGVGKTYLAQELAKFIFNSDKVLKRFDMSEYMESHAVSKLFGSPPGYVGYNEGGQLTEAVNRNPYSIILFDEIEKAHPRIFDALLQVLDAGRMTDGQGKIVDFKNTIIIMTSNIGSDIIKNGLIENLDPVQVEESLLIEADNHFRPEFLNRFDAKVMFNALDLKAIVKVAQKELELLAEKLHNDNHLDLQWHPNVPKLITRESYDLVNGARPIKRYISDRLITILSNGILNGKINRGDIIYIPWQKDSHGLEVQVVSQEELADIKEVETKDGILQLEVDNNLPKKKRKKKKVKKDSFINIQTELGD